MQLTYKITVNDNFFKMKFTGEFSGKGLHEITTKAKEFYAQELDTIPSEIKIVKIEAII